MRSLTSPAIAFNPRVNDLGQNFDLTDCPSGQKEGEEEPDVVISDVRMPGADGTELLAELRRTHPNIAIVMLTAFAEVDLAVQCLRNGASDFLTKPVRAAHLVTAVERAVERRRLILENRSHQENLEIRVEEATTGLTEALQELDLAYDMTLAALSSAVDAREEGTGNHSRRVTRMADTLAESLGLDLTERKHLSRGARIFSVVDALDAMTSTRSYRKAMSLDDALAELDRCCGTQFDPEVVTTLHALGRERIASFISNEAGA